MTLPEIYNHFELGKTVQRLLSTRSKSVDQTHLKQVVIPFLRKVIPTLQLTARDETANWYGVTAESLTQDYILTFLLYHKEYDAVEISRIVEYWRKDYGTNE